MAVISGGRVIEGAQLRPSGGASGGTDAGALGATQVGYGPYTNAGVPASGFLNAVAQKGALVIDTTNGKLYINTGTLAATVWTVVGTQS
jgi:hypothetical protein